MRGLNRLKESIWGLSLIVCTLSLAPGLLAAPSDYSSPIDACANKSGSMLYIAELGTRRISYFDPRHRKVTKQIQLKEIPNGLTLSHDESTLYVTTESPKGIIYVINVEKGKIERTLCAGHTPMAPVLSHDSKTLYVCNRFNNNISVINIASKKEITRIQVTREPVAQVLTLDGKHLYVANHLPAGSANVDRMTSVVDIIDTSTNKRIKSIPLPNGAIDLRDICLSHDGKYVLVPSILARFLVPTTQIERGWINTHALNLINTATQDLYYTILLDDVDMGAANPWGIECSSEGKYICIAHSATHELSLIDYNALLEKLSIIPKEEAQPEGKTTYSALSQDPANDLSFLAGIRKRIQLKGNNPRNLTIANNKVYITEHLSDSIGIVDLNRPNSAASSIALGNKTKPDIIRQGEIYFNDASLCFQKWQSCSTCHPDARTDAVNWDLLNDGIGNPKSTKSMLNSHVTPPSMITGVRDCAERAVRAGIQHIQFSVPEEVKAKAIDEYLKSLKPIPSPRLVMGKLSKKAKEGEVIFQSAGCSSCHHGPYYTDMQKYDVGIADGMEAGTAFDTPSLIEVWRTAPYLYDGRAATMKSVFTKYNKNGMHGMTTSLSDKEMDSLIEFVMSL